MRLKGINKGLLFTMLFLMLLLAVISNLNISEKVNRPLEKSSIISDYDIRNNTSVNKKEKESNVYKGGSYNRYSIEDLKKQYKNTDIEARLRIDSLEVDTVVTQSSNNNYYLNHDAYKNENKFGTPYLDYRYGSNLDEEKQLNIYSHNSNVKVYSDKLPFFKLRKLLDKSAFEKAGDIYLYTSSSVHVYEPYALKIVTTDNEHMVLASSNEEKWQQHLDKLLSNTMYCKKNCHLNGKDKLLVLQTCNYNPSNSYIVIVAREKN